MKKFSLRVSGSRLGSDVRPAAEAEAEVVRHVLTKPRFGLKIHTSPLATAPISPDDYATAEDYE